MKDFLRKILNEICIEEKIKCIHLSGEYITKLEKDGKTRYISGTHMGCNSYMATLLADDKYAMYEVLKNAGIPVIEFKLVWDRNNVKSNNDIEKRLKEIKEYYIANNRHIVLKPNRGYAGKDMYNIIEENQIEPAFRELLDQTDTIVVNPFYKAKHEHRVIILNGKVRLIYKKTLGKNEWQFNLTHSGRAYKIQSKKLEEKLETLAMKAYNQIGADFVSVDIFECEDEELKILEINGSVSMEKYVEQMPEEYEKVKNIYRDAIRSMFM